MCKKINYIYKCNCRSKGYLCNIHSCNKNRYFKYYINENCHGCITNSINKRNIKMFLKRSNDKI